MTVDIVIGAAVAVVAVFLLVSFFSVKFGFVDPTPAGCSGHHFEERRKTGNYRVRTNGRAGIGAAAYYTAEKEVELRCQHNGCRKTKTKWRQINDRVEKRAAASFDCHPDDCDDMIRTKAFETESVAREVLAGHISDRAEGSA